MKLQVTYRERFVDPRLVNHPSDHHEEEQHGEDDFISVTGEDFKEFLWTPDTFFRNTVDEQIMGAIKENSYARIYHDGTVLVSRRIQMTVQCPEIDQWVDGKTSCKLEVASCES